MILKTKIQNIMKTNKIIIRPFYSTKNFTIKEKTIYK